MCSQVVWYHNGIALIVATQFFEVDFKLSFRKLVCGGHGEKLERLSTD